MYEADTLLTTSSKGAKVQISFYIVQSDHHLCFFADFSIIHVFLPLYPIFQASCTQGFNAVTVGVILYESCY